MEKKEEEMETPAEECPLRATPTNYTYPTVRGLPVGTPTWKVGTRRDRASGGSWSLAYSRT